MIEVSGSEGGVTDLGMLLIGLAFFNQLYGVFEHCRPVIPLSQSLCCQGSGSNMVAIDAFMHLFEHIVSVFLFYRFWTGSARRRWAGLQGRIIVQPTTCTERIDRRGCASGSPMPKSALSY